jgi:hypothetical protein
MYNEFIFHPVGQGLFYTGKIENLNFVFDCGSLGNNASTPGHNLHRSINDYLASNPNVKLDFLVISHLDSDHFNGIPHLLKNNSVKRVFLPYIPDGLRKKGMLRLFLYSIGVEEEDVIEMLEGYYLECIDNIEELNLENDEYPNRVSTFRVRSKLYMKSKNWNFLLYNKDNFIPAFVAQVVNEIDSLAVTMGFDSVEDAVTDMNFLKQANHKYAKTLKVMNQTSIVMMHYPSNGISLYPCPLCCGPCCIGSCAGLYRRTYHEEVISLLTGDINFYNTGNMNIQNDINRSGYSRMVVQLPHHGSNKNFTSFIGSFNSSSSDFVMCYGVINPHPSSFPNMTTVAQIMSMPNVLYKVNEYIMFSYSMCI